MTGTKEGAKKAAKTRNKTTLDKAGEKLQAVEKKVKSVGKALTHKVKETFSST